MYFFKDVHCMADTLCNRLSSLIDHLVSKGISIDFEISCSKYLDFVIQVDGNG